MIPRILQLRSHWLKSEKESLRLVEAGITKEVMNSAIAQFCLEIIAKHGDPAPRLCNKDPLTLKMGTYVIELFPNVRNPSKTTQSISSLWPKSFAFNSDFSTTFSVSFQAKFLFMVRDGRATVHSIISRKVTITGFDLTSYRQCMQKWNHAIEVMHDQCKEIGKERCMMVSVVWSGLVGQCSVCFQSVQCNIPTFCMRLQMTATSETVTAERKNSILKYPNSCGSND